MTQRSVQKRSMWLSTAVLFVLALMMHPLTAHAATDRYVATTGADTNSGAFSSPYRTIQKCASVAQAGDTCFIRAGTYRETVTPANSGMSSASITFQPYNSESVTVSGADLVSGWSSYSGNIYQANVTLPVNGYSDTNFFANQVFVDDQMMIEARWPNTGFDLLDPTLATAGNETTSSATTTTIYDANIPNISGGWNGAIAHVIGGFGWVAHTGQVASSAPGQITYSTVLAPFVCPDACAKPNNQYYLTGKFAALDSATEWFYDGGAGKLYLWTANSDSPANHTVEVKQRTNAFNLAGRDYVHIKNLRIFAATISTDATSDYNTIDGINASYVSHYVTIPYGDSTCSIYCAHAGDSGIILDGSYNTLKNSTIAYSAGNGVALLGSNNIVTNNLIHDTDYAAVYNSPVQLGGVIQTITNNTLYNTGRDGINGGAGGNEIAYNNVYNFGMINHDLGGYYTCCSQDGTGTSIHHNWMHDNRAKTNGGINASKGAGIYIDNQSHHFLVHHNLLWNNAAWGIFFHGNGASSQYNLAYNNTAGQGQEYGIAVGNTNDGTGTRLINNISQTGFQSAPNVDSANNLLSVFPPLFVDPATNRYFLQSNSPAVDYGQAISGITDGYIGSAPDAGAYESGAADWGPPGCNFAGCSPTSINLIDNSGFEGGSASKWTWTSGAFVASTTTPHTGRYVARASGTSSGVGQVVYGLSPNTTYTLSAWAKAGSTTEAAVIGVKRYAGESSYTDSSIASTNYTQTILSFITGANNTSAEIFLWKSSGSGDAYADDFSLTHATANRITNPGFESGDLGTWSTWVSEASIVASNAHSGSYAVRLRGEVVGVEQTITGLSPNTTYTYSGWAKVNTVGENVLIGVKDFGGTETYATITTTSYNQGLVTFTTGSSNTTAKIYFYKHTGSGEAFGDDFSLQ